ncbi:urease accessory protein UreF [Actinokineospora sp.]|uniref:urease accessory protein UreF n=1 Tax=Actinokineospora sp. TaxID=1872133 RepID=UPI004037D607
MAPPRAPLVADRLEQGRPPKGRAGAVLGAGVAEQGWAGPGAGAGGQGWIGLRAGAGRGGVQEAGVGLGAEVSGGVRVVPWAGLDGELDARTPSVAQRVASRAQGRGTMRAGLRVWPSSVLAELVAAVARPHHAVALGAVTGVAGGSAGDAAAVAGYLSVSGPASAAVRLLGLDPFAVTAMIADLADELRAQTLRATRFVGTAPADLPAPGAPGLDLLAESHARHHTEEVRLFAS